jgi:hypothetical protein
MGHGKNILQLICARAGGNKTAKALENIKQFSIYAVPTLILFDEIIARGKKLNVEFTQISSRTAPSNSTVTRHFVEAITHAKKYILCTHEALKLLVQQNVDVDIYNLIIDEIPIMVSTEYMNFTGSDILYYKNLIKTQDSGLVLSSETEADLSLKIKDLGAGRNSQIHSLNFYKALYSATYGNYSGFTQVYKIHDTEASLTLGYIDRNPLIKHLNDFNSVTLVTADDPTKGLGKSLLADGYIVPEFANDLPQKFDGKIGIFPLTNMNRISSKALDSLYDGKTTVREYMVNIGRKFNASIMINKPHQSLVKDPIPPMSHGINQYRDKKGICIAFASRPDPIIKKVIRLSNEISEDEWIQTNYFDRVYQAATRGNMRNNGDQIIFVPDIESALFLESKCENASIDARYALNKNLFDRRKSNGKKKSFYNNLLGGSERFQIFKRWAKSNGITIKANDENDDLFFVNYNFKVAYRYKKFGGIETKRWVKFRRENNVFLRKNPHCR